MPSRLTETLSSRFSISLLTACALHVILLFGIISSRAPANTPGSTLSVTLSTAPVRTAQTAETLAIHNQRGDDSQSSPRPQLQSPAEAEQPARDSAPQKTSQPEQAQTVTLARPSDSGRRRMATQPKLSVAAAPQPETAALARTPEQARAARADSRAAYLEAWRQIIERLGNRNLPEDALRQSSGKRLTLEVTLAADGGLINTRVLKSSGNDRLDQAVLQLLRDAAPFGAFTPSLRRAYPQITFAYDWRFLPPASARKAPDQVVTPINP